MQIRDRVERAILQRPLLLPSIAALISTLLAIMAMVEAP